MWGLRGGQDRVSVDAEFTKDDDSKRFLIRHERLTPVRHSFLASETSHTVARGHDAVGATDLVRLLRDQPLCFDCLAERYPGQRQELTRRLEELGFSRRLWRQEALCAGCIGVRMTYRLRS